MRSRLLRILLSVLVAANAHASEVAELLTVSATSSSTSSTSLTCVFDPKCNGFWSPSARDTGNDEGIMIQFSEPTLVDFISIEVDTDPSSTSGITFQAYLEGKTALSESSLDSRQTTVDTAEFKGRSKGQEAVFLVGGRSSASLPIEKLTPLRSKVRSIYLKLINTGATRGDAIKLKRIAFHRLRSDIALNAVGIKALRTPMALKLPKLLPASASATSTLEPALAYDAFRLFDSQIDMAWSTNGKSSSGIGEEVVVHFDQPQAVSALLVWNGYQRSKAHFRDNSRVKKILLQTGQTSEEVMLSDTYGVQKIVLAKPRANVSTIKLQIQSVYSGSKYKDVVLSELRFIDETGNIGLPLVSAPRFDAPAFIKPVLDRSFSTCLHGIAEGPREGCESLCSKVSLRFRSNGTFVIYRESEILEGNWDPRDRQLRIFGKKYETSFQSAEYLQQRVSVPQATVFQSALSFREFNQMSEADRAKAIQYHLKTAKREQFEDGTSLSWATGFSGALVISGKSEAILAMKVASELRKRNAFFVESSVFTGIVLPFDDVVPCTAGC